MTRSAAEPDPPPHPPALPEATRANASAGLPMRVLGVALLALLLFPWYRLVGVRASGPAAEQTLRLGGSYLAAVWVGGGLVLLLAALLERTVARARAERLGARASSLLLAPSPAAFAAGAGAVAVAVALWVTHAVLDAQPALMDGVSQLVHARYLAAGRVAGPPLEHPEFFQFQFMVLADGGWASQYPPAFPLLLALGRWIPAWLVGPALLGVAIVLVALSAERLFAGDPLVGRLGSALAALSPLLAFHAAAYMSHVLALTLAAAAAYASLRALVGSWTWALAAGAAVGAGLATRPWTGLVLGAVATVGVWLWAPRPPGFGARDLARRVGVALAGAAPFAALVLFYNARLFGGPFRLGYLVAEGPGHGLGFHTDPWGDPYGPVEALGYTAADLQGLSLDLLQTLAPVGLLVAIWLVVARRLAPGARVAAAWALVPVIANAFYWHHDLFMGPRLLYEAAPGWCLLAASAAVGLVRGDADGDPTPPRHGLGLALAATLLLAVVYAAPQKLASYRTAVERAGMRVPLPEVDGPALVFVHGSWEDRLAARLAAGGMRVDSVRAALAHNSSCEIELALAGRAAGGAGWDELAFAARPGAPPLRALAMPSGSVVRARPGETLALVCERQAASDFGGAIGLPPLLWRGDLPGLAPHGAMFARDLGPERNRRLIASHPGREPVVFALRDGALKLLPYEAGMRDLWSGGEVTP